MPLESSSEKPAHKNLLELKSEIAQALEGTTTYERNNPNEWKRINAYLATIGITEDDIRNFQKEQNLAVDGKAGVQTLAALGINLEYVDSSIQTARTEATTEPAMDLMSAPADSTEQIPKSTESASGKYKSATRIGDSIMNGTGKFAAVKLEKDLTKVGINIKEVSRRFFAEWNSGNRGPFVMNLGLANSAHLLQKFGHKKLFEDYVKPILDTGAQITIVTQYPWKTKPKYPDAINQNHLLSELMMAQYSGNPNISFVPLHKNHSQLDSMMAGDGVHLRANGYRAIDKQIRDLYA